jgi:hypothetical protein
LRWVTSSLRRVSAGAPAADSSGSSRGGPKAGASLRAARAPLRAWAGEGKGGRAGRGSPFALGLGPGVAADAPPHLAHGLRVHRPAVRRGEAAGGEEGGEGGPACAHPAVQRRAG